MDQSLSLFSAQVEFLDDRLALVHIPLDIYPYFIQPILQLIFHEVPPIDKHVNYDAKARAEADADGDADAESEAKAEDEAAAEAEAEAAQPAFLNLSITPVECSVTCPRHLADLYFAPLVERFGALSSESGVNVSISRDDYIAMQVFGEGLDAGQRVLELTSPLAMAGISIFFISTYFSDYIVVPLHSKAQVITALESRGFQFETSTDAFVNGSQQLPATNTRPSSSASASAPTSTSPPPTPPPSTLTELQTRTFDALRRHKIVPSVDKSLRLVQCAAHHRYSTDDSPPSTSTSILRPALTMALLVDRPRFLSLTLTATDPAASLLLEKRLLPRFSERPDSPRAFGDGGDGDGDESSVLLGSKEDVLVPITLDLRGLPLEATGIVCGVAGRLAAATHGGSGGGFDSGSEDSFTTANPNLTQNSNSNSNADMEKSVHSLESFNSYRFLQSRDQVQNQDQDRDQNSSSSSIHSNPISNSNSNSNSNSPTSSNDDIRLSSSSHHIEPDPDRSSLDAVEISFLSTARAGTVIVGERELERAVDALDAESRRESGVE